MDLYISFDSTGSMMPCIHEARRRISEFLDTIFTVIPDLRVGIVAHGDYEDRPYQTKHLPLTTDKAALIKFIQTVEQTSGFGNGGECYELVMHELSYADWKSDKKVVVMVGDEPAHIKNRVIHTYSYGSRFTVPYAWKEEAEQLKENGITVYPVRCLNRSDSVKYHRDLAQFFNVPLLHLHQFNNIIELLTAVSYRQVGESAVEEYADGLKAQGLLNRNLANIIDQLLGKANLTSFSTAYGNVDELKLVDPTRFQVLHVDNKVDIKTFVENTGASFRKGRGFYQLTKVEEIQERKEVVLQDKNGDFYSGNKAREMIGLPYGERGKVGKQYGLDFTVFVQSTSVNRVLMPNTLFLYDTN